MTHTTETLELRPSPKWARTAGMILVVTAASWIYLFLLRAEMGEMSTMGAMGDIGAMGGTGAMGGMGGTGDMAMTDSSRSMFAMPMTSAWTAGDLVLMGTMWAVMMAAMMLPSATPMVKAYDAAVGNPARSSGNGSTPLFVAGYLLAWSGFALAATAVQWKLHDAALVDSMGVATSRWLAGGLLLAAGAYQFSPVKEACLGTCRTPLGFLATGWRPGRKGALSMGVRHGSLCIGCCWALMALLFVLGVMNLWWIAAVAAVVLIEKFTRSAALPKLVGAALMVWATFVLTGITEMGVSQ